MDLLNPNDASSSEDPEFGDEGDSSTITEDEVSKAVKNLLGGSTTCGCDRAVLADTSLLHI